MSSAPPPPIGPPGSAPPPRLAPPSARPPLPLPPPHPSHPDGLIRMLLQSATPTNVSLPSTPLPPASASSGVTLSPSASPAPAPVQSAVTVAGVSTPPSAAAAVVAPVAPLLSPSQHETEDAKADSYIHQISGNERVSHLIVLDHSYSRPWNTRPDAVGGVPGVGGAGGVVGVAHPTRTLFVHKVSRQQQQQQQQQQQPFSRLPLLASNEREVIDVTNEPATCKRPYDPDKAKHLMRQCERYVNFANPDVLSLEENLEWEENISRDGWTPEQHRLFYRTLKILHLDRVGRLSQDSVDNEAVFRRLVVDKTAKRVRCVLAGVLWDGKMTQWLHNTLCDHLPKEYLSAYLDVLQTLRAKIPTLVDKMMAGRRTLNGREDVANIAKKGVRLLLRRKWDPTGGSVSQQKLKQLPGNPIVLLTPSGPNDFWQSGSSRARLWTDLLSGLGQVITVPFSVAPAAPAPVVNPVEEPATPTDEATPSQPSPPTNTTVGQLIHQVVTSIISKIREVKRANQDRPVLLISWGVGSAINCQVAAMEPVSACVCLGFPMYTLAGARGADAMDPLLDLKCPLLFVVGQLAASQSRSDDIEDMRERMKSDTGLVIVGGADEQLRMSKHKKRQEGITQSMVDRCIMDEMRNFLISLLTAPPPTFALPNYQGLTTPEAGQPGGMGNSGGIGGPPGGTGTGGGGGASARKTPNSRSRKRPNGTGSPAKRKPAAGRSPAKSAVAAALAHPVMPPAPAPTTTLTSTLTTATGLPAFMTAQAQAAAAVAAGSGSTATSLGLPADMDPKSPKITQVKLAGGSHPGSPMAPVPSMAGMAAGMPMPRPGQSRMMPQDLISKSPLLSSALTSPTKTTTMTKLTTTAMLSTSKIPAISIPPPAPSIKSPLSMPTMPTLSTMLQQPHLPHTPLPQPQVQQQQQQQRQQQHMHIQQQQPVSSVKGPRGMHMPQQQHPNTQLLNISSPTTAMTATSHLSKLPQQPAILSNTTGQAAGGSGNMLVISSQQQQQHPSLTKASPLMQVTAAAAATPHATSTAPLATVTSHRQTLGALAAPTVAGATRYPVPVSTAAMTYRKVPAAALGTTTTMSATETAAGSSGQLAQPSQKDNLYIVAVPQDQAKALAGTSNLVQYHANPIGNQTVIPGGEHSQKMLALVGGTGGDKGKGGVTAALTTVKDASVSIASSQDPSTPTSTDRRNVAEILASLSGLVPEPQAAAASTKTTSATPASSAGITSTAATSAASSKSSTTKVSPAVVASSTPVTATLSSAIATPTPSPRPTAAILSSPTGSGGGSGRIVRVLQSGSRLQNTPSPIIKAVPVIASKSAPSPAPSVPPTPSPTQTTATVQPPTTTSAATTMRSRKQVFVTADKKDIASAASAAGSTAAGESAADKKDTVIVRQDTSANEDKASASESANRRPEFEQDILEEDVNDDAEYVPYQKKAKSAPAKPKGRPPTRKK